MKISKRTLFLLLLAAAAVYSIYLTYWVLPGINVARLASNDQELYDGPVLAQISSNHRIGSCYTVYPTHLGNWRNIRISSGWDAVLAWLPFTFVIFATGVGVGILFGFFAARDAAKEEYKDRISRMTEETKRLEKDLEKSNCQNSKYERTLAAEIPYVKRIEKDAAERIAAAEETAIAECKLSLAAEFKMQKQQEEHIAEMAKAGARISELKHRLKEKNKGID